MSHLGHLNPSGLSGVDPKYSGIGCILNCNIDFMKRSILSNKAVTNISTICDCESSQAEL